MRYVTLDSIILGICSEKGDEYGHRYAEFYKLVHSWFRDAKDSRLGGRPTTVRVPVTDRRAWIPQGMSVSKVGVNVNGSISVLLPNNNMLDLTDDCGEYVAPDTGNPDAPAYNYGNLDVRGGMGWRWNSPGLIGTTASFLNYSSTFWPGQGGGKSIRGYYRIFPEKGYMLLDRTYQFAEIIMEGAVPTFMPGYTTWIPEICAEAIRAWLSYEPIRLMAEVQAKYGSMVERPRRNYVRAMGALRMALNSEPLAVMIAAVQSRVGTTDIF